MTLQKKIPIDLDVPFLPAGVRGVTPAFLFEQVKDRFKERIPLNATLAPIVASPQVAPPNPSGGHLLVSSNNATRRALELQPREIAVPAADQRLGEGQEHDEQTRGYGIKLRLDSRAQHVGKRDTKGATQHQVGDNPQHRQEDSQSEEKKREDEPLDTADVVGDFRLSRRVDRLEKAFTKDSVIDDRAIDEPGETRRTVNLSTPFRRAGWTEKNEVLETQH
jgi:hypothetical protein